MSSPSILKSFQWDIVENPHEPKSCGCFKKQKVLKVNILEIAGALIQNHNDFKIIIDFIIKELDTHIFLNAEIKMIGEKDPASNLRFKKNIEKNNTVIDNYIHLFNEYRKISSNPIVISTFGRNDRLYSFNMNENGEIICSNTNTKEILSEKSQEFTNFIKSFGIDEEKMKIIRECSKEAKYNTYMIDIISFIQQVCYIINKDLLFDEEYRKPVVVNTKTTDSNGTILLTDVTTDGKIWKPVEKQNYLYFQPCDEYDPEAIKVSYPKNSSIDTIYDYFWEMLSPINTSGIKRMVRRHFNNCKTYRRWSDYSINDTDDAFTILAIINCFNCCDELTDDEKLICNQFKAIIRPWFTELGIKY